MTRRMRTAPNRRRPTVVLAAAAALLVAGIGSAASVRPGGAFGRRTGAGATRSPATGRVVASQTAPRVERERPELLRRRQGAAPEQPEWTGEEPLSVLVVMDLSSSVSGARLEAAISGVTALFSALSEEDRCALLTFTRSVELHAGWDGTCAAAAVAAAEVRGGGPAALNNALTLALGLLADAPPRRPVLVVFTDGVDGASWARDSWPLHAAGNVLPTVLSVTAPPVLSGSGRVGGVYGSIDADDLANRIVYEGRQLQDSGRDLRGLRNVDPFWVLTQLVEMGGGVLVRTGGAPDEIETALAGLLDAIGPTR